MLRQCRHIFFRSLRHLTTVFTDAGIRRILWMPLVAFSLPSRNEAQLRHLTSFSFMSLFNGIINEATKNNLAWRLHIVDKCLDAGLYSVAREILEDEENQSVEVLWRLGKTMYLLYEEEVIPEYKKELLLKGSELLQQALQMSENNPEIHKWISVVLEVQAEKEGIFEKECCLQEVKTHLLRAASLNPKDGTTLHLLGMWHFKVAEGPWYRKFLSCVCSTICNSTYENALAYFLEAERAEPGKNIRNLFYIGITFHRLGYLLQAARYYHMTLKYPKKAPKDKHLANEAKELLEGIKSFIPQMNALN